MNHTDVKWSRLCWGLLVDRGARFLIRMVLFLQLLLTASDAAPGKEHQPNSSVHEEGDIGRISQIDMNEQVAMIWCLVPAQTYCSGTLIIWSTRHPLVSYCSQAYCSANGSQLTIFDRSAPHISTNEPHQAPAPTLNELRAMFQHRSKIMALNFCATLQLIVSGFKERLRRAPSSFHRAQDGGFSTPTAFHHTQSRCLKHLLQ